MDENNKKTLAKACALTALAACVYSLGKHSGYEAGYAAGAKAATVYGRLSAYERILSVLAG